MDQKVKTDEISPGYFLVDPSKSEGARLVASSLPGYNFKNVPAFFDVGGVTQNPKALRACIDMFEDRARSLKPAPTCIVGLDARGFIFGPLVAQRLNIPFLMMRKKGKLPGPTIAEAYETEYSKDVLTISCNYLSPKDNVLIYDDLIATGGTTIAAAKLILASGAKVAEVHVVTAITFFEGWKKFRAADKRLKDVGIFAIADANYTLEMPKGSTDTYQLEVGSMEHRCAVEAASKKSKPSDVLCRTSLFLSLSSFFQPILKHKTGTLDKTSSGAYTVKFEMKSMGPGRNMKYLEEGKDH